MFARSDKSASPLALLSLIFPLLLAACGSAGSDHPVNEPIVDQGNAEQITKDYARLAGASDSAISRSTDATASSNPSDSMADEFAREILQMVNEARAQKRICGDKEYSAVGPLKWNTRAAKAALLEVQWMQTKNTFGHVWETGERVWERLDRSGYAWKVADENIAAGFRSTAAAMKAWIDSPGHCKALMRGDLQDVGVAVIPGTKDNTYLSYWAMVFGTPR